MKKQICAILAALMVFCGAAMPVSAAAGEYDTDVVFTNRREDAVGLTVHKEVVTDSDSVTPDPDAEFTFVLLVNDAAAKRAAYRCYNAAGKRIVHCYDSESGAYLDLTEDEYKEQQSLYLQEVGFTTGANGFFKLKDGETVVFTGLNVGDRYQVQEVDLPDNYVLVFPADEEGASGVITGEDDRVDFRNKFSPPPPLPPSPEFRSLKVVKTIVTLSGYEAVGLDQKFSFKVEVAGEPWAAKDYKIYDAQTNAYIGAGVTTEEGILSICGNQMAITEGIPEYSLYSVTELPAENWWPVGSDYCGGSVGNESVEAKFTNNQMSFGVSKAVEGTEETEASFQFQLLREDGSGWENASYYLYGGDKKLVDSELHATGEFGTFTLQAGQKALFVGIRPGTVYSVREMTNAGYVQVLPANEAGYEGETVHEGTPKILPFINRPEEKNGELRVSKQVMSERPDSGEIRDTEFIFQLTRGTTPMANCTYEISGNTYKTDENGWFSLKDNETAVFSKLPLGKQYTVTELGIREDGAQTVTMGKFISLQQQQTGELEEDGLTFAFINVYKGGASLQIRKVDEKDRTKLLPGAVFELSRIPEDGEAEDIFLPVTVTTDENGRAEITGMPSGTYSLVETKAPKSYYAPKDPIVFKVSVKDETLEILSENMPADQSVETVDDEVVITLTVSNAFSELPSSGGMGTEPFVYGGLLLLGLGAAYAVLLRRRRIL